MMQCRPQCSGNELCRQISHFESRTSPKIIIFMIIAYSSWPQFVVWQIDVGWNTAYRACREVEKNMWWTPIHSSCSISPGADGCESIKVMMVFANKHKWEWIWCNDIDVSTHRDLPNWAHFKDIYFILLFKFVDSDDLCTIICWLTTLVIINAFIVSKLEIEVIEPWSNIQPNQHHSCTAELQNTELWWRDRRNGKLACVSDPFEWTNLLNMTIKHVYVYIRANMMR